jgi:hypothetical protein
MPLFFVVLAALAASATPAVPAEPLPDPAGYRLVSRFTDLPSPLRDAILTVLVSHETRRPAELQRPLTREMLLAEPTEPYQATDILQHDRPERRLLFAGVGVDAFVLYEHGGIGHHLHVMFFRPTTPGFDLSRNLVFTLGYRGKRPTSIKALWRLLRERSATPAMRGDA